VPLICPTCQNVFAGFAQSIHAATTTLLCMGLFSIFRLEARAASVLAAVFAVDDLRMACRADGSLHGFGDLFGSHQGWEIGVCAWHHREDRGVDDAQTLYALDAALRIDDRHRIVCPAHAT
jgi:hypothetical protein